MRRWEEGRDAIESSHFAAQLGLASGLRTARMALEGAPEVQRLRQYLRQAPNDITRVLERIRVLVTAQIDPRYESPYDAALAGYLWVLRSMSRSAYVVAAELSLNAPQTWWAAELSRAAIQEQDPAVALSGDQVRVFELYGGGSSVPVNTPHSHQATDLVVRSQLLLGVQRVHFAISIPEESPQGQWRFVSEAGESPLVVRSAAPRALFVEAA